MLKHLVQYPGLLTGASDTMNLEEKDRYSMAKIHFSFLSVALLFLAYLAGGGIILYSLTSIGILECYVILWQMRKEMTQQRSVSGGK